MRVKNWKKHQHFKDRNPPWIKLHKELLDDPDFHDLDGESVKVLIMLWLIASEDKDHEGRLPDIRKLSFRLRMTESKVNQALTKLSNWVYQDDINTISEQYQLDAPETETETEGEAEFTHVYDVCVPKPSARIPPDCPIKEIEELYNATLPTLTRSEHLTETRRKFIRSRWREMHALKEFDTREQGLEWFKRYFVHIGQSKFLTGRVRPNGDKKPFVADIEWIFRPNNFAKIVEGRYQ